MGQNKRLPSFGDAGHGGGSEEELGRSKPKHVFLHLIQTVETQFKTHFKEKKDDAELAQMMHHVDIAHPAETIRPKERSSEKKAKNG